MLHVRFTILFVGPLKTPFDETGGISYPQHTGWGFGSDSKGQANVVFHVKW